MAKTAFEKAVYTLGALSYEELKKLRVELDKLIAEYDEGLAISGEGFIEVKLVRKKQYHLDGRPVIDEKTGEQVVKEFGPYAYVRKWVVDKNGNRRLVNAGYYGKAGAQIVYMGLGNELLEAHNRGGEEAGEAFIAAVLGDQVELPKRWVGLKPPIEEPKNPLGVDVTFDEIVNHPLFKVFQEAAPEAATRLLVALRHYESDLTQYYHANNEGLRYRLPLRELNRRRAYTRMRESPQPLRRIRRVGKRGRRK